MRRAAESRLWVDRPPELASLYDRLSTGPLPAAQLPALIDSYLLQTASEPSGAPRPVPGLAAYGPAPGGTPLAQSPFASIASVEPLAAMRGVGASSVDRVKLEGAIRDLFHRLHQDGLPLEARPGSALAEGLASGDLSGLTSQELLAVLVAMMLFQQNASRPDSIAARKNMPLAPLGSWGPNGQRAAASGGVRTGANRDAEVTRGPPRPDGTLPSTSAPGQSLASSAEGVARSMGSIGKCYRGVKAAVRQATGVSLVGGSAAEAAPQLAASGKFREVQLSPQQLGSLPAGAVVVWGRTGRSPHGHISVALGDGREASDHIQQQITSLRGASNYRVFVPAA